MADLAENNRDFAPEPQLEPAPDASPVRGPSPAANASAFIIPKASQEECDPDPLADDTSPINPFSDEGGKPGRVVTADMLSKKFFIELATENNIGGNGGGPLNQETRQQREARLLAEAEELFAEMTERRERRQQELEKQQREFDERMHSIGGHQFTGKELMEMRDWLKDEKNQKQFEDDLMTKHGISREEAKRRRLEVEEALELKKKEREGKLTPEEKRRMEILLAKPGVGEDLKILQERDKKNWAMSASTIDKKSDDQYANAYQTVFSDDSREKLEAQAANEPAYKKPNAAAFSASENLISDKRLSSTYNTAAVGKTEPVRPEPAKLEVTAAIAPLPQKLENTVQVSGSGFG